MKFEGSLEFILSSISNEIRVEVLKLINREGPLSFTEIMERLQMDPKVHAGKFGYHLRMLIEADLIRADETSGKYYLTPLGQEVSNLIYGIEDVMRRKKNEMLVRTSRLTIEPFDRKKIVEALVREANMPRRLADIISKEAEERLKKSQIHYLTAALIREFVNAILLERGLEEYRHVLTRLGQPVYDVTQTIKNAALHGNPSPEMVHSTAGDAVFEEYMLLKVIPRTIADAHLCGSLHLNNANYWVLRPANIFHDIRPFINGKIYPDGSGLIFPYPKPPFNLKGALVVINCLLKNTLSCISTTQSIPLLNVFLAPFAKGLSKEEVLNSVKEFIFNLNIMLGGSYKPLIAFDMELGIPNFLENVKCIGPDGNKYVYGDFFKESLLILDAFIEVLSEADGFSKPFLNPALFIKLRKKSLILSETQECLMKIYGLSRKFGNIYFINQEAPWQNENTAYNLDLSRAESNSKDWERNTLRVSVLDNITINLPRVTYEAKGDDDKLREKLSELVELSIEALNIKKQVMEERIFSDNLIPLFKEKVDGSSYLRLGESMGVISYVGLPEAVKHHTDNNIWESKDAMDLAKNIINLIQQYSNEAQIRVFPSSITFEPVSKRLTDLDIKSGYIKPKEFKHYTEHSNLPLNIAIELKMRLKIEEEFQKLTRGGHVFDFRLEEPAPTEEVIANYVKRIIETVEIGLFTLTRDYIYCPRCGQISYGTYLKCPYCEYDGEKLILYTKVFGRLKPSISWSDEEKDFVSSIKHYIL